MGAFLDTFEATVMAGRWPRDQWPLFLRGSLSGAGLTVVATMTAARQADYDAVKNELLREYHISTEMFRKCVFDTLFDSAHPDGWLSAVVSLVTTLSGSYHTDGNHAEALAQMVRGSNQEPQP